MFSRFEALENFNKEDQKQLEDSKVAVVGLGATGSVIAEHLARHGISLVVIDRDYLEPKDIYSSSIYKPRQCEKAMPKAIAAEKELEIFTDIESKVESLNPENIDILKDVDLILDGTDNLETRFLINEYSKKRISLGFIPQQSVKKDIQCFLIVNVSTVFLRKLEPDRLRHVKPPEYSEKSQL